MTGIISTLSVTSDGLLLDLTTGKIIYSTIHTGMRIFNNKNMQINTGLVAKVLSKGHVAFNREPQLKIDQKFEVNIWL